MTRISLVATVCLLGCTEAQVGPTRSEVTPAAEAKVAEAKVAEAKVAEARVEAKVPDAAEARAKVPVDAKSLPPQPPERTKEFWAAIQPARKATAAKDYDAAIAGFTAALAIAPGHARALSGRGYAALLKGDLKAAEADLRAALAATQDVKLEAAAHFNMGLLLEKKVDLEGARRHFQRSNELRPSRPAAAKLSESPVCVADIDATILEPEIFKNWRALWDRYPDEHTRPPKDEAEAKQRLCGTSACAPGKLEILDVGYEDAEMDWFFAEASLLLLAGADGVRVQVIGDVSKASACNDTTDWKDVEMGAWYAVWSREIVCSWVDQDCEDEEACEGMTREYNHEGMTYRVFDPRDLRRVAMLDSPEDAAEAPVVQVAIDGDAVRLSGGRCERSWTLPRG